jgi:hypothetical protein
MAVRLQDVQRKIELLYDKLKVGEKTVLLCESETTFLDPRAARKVEQVRGIFETVARQTGALVPGRVNPRSVQFEVLGLKGKQAKRDDVKASACHVASSLYGKSLMNLGLDISGTKHKHQDIVDAILIGHFSLSKIQQAHHAGVDIESLFAEPSARRRVEGKGW